jgi:hypothetical protein
MERYAGLQKTQVIINQYSSDYKMVAIKDGITHQRNC